MKGLLDQPTEILHRVVHYLSPWDIEAFTSTHSLLRGVGSQALAVHCKKKRRFAHLELGCNETIHPLDLISDLLEHEENVEYVQSLSVGYDNAIESKDSKISPDKIVHLLARYPNLKAKAERVMRASTWCREEAAFPLSKEWNHFPHLYPSSECGYAEDIMYFLMSLSSNLNLLRLVDDGSVYQPLQYLTNGPTPDRCCDAVSSSNLREVRLYRTCMARCCEFLNNNISLEILKAQNVMDDISSDELSDICPTWDHPSLHTIVFERSAVSAETFHRLLNEAKVLRSFTYSYDDCGEGPAPPWEPHKILTILINTGTDRLVHLDMTHPKRELCPYYTFDGLRSNLWLLYDFKVLKTLRLESVLLFKAQVKHGPPMAKTSISTKKPPLKFNLEMGDLGVQQLLVIIPNSAAKVSLVGNLYKEDAVAITKGLDRLASRALAFSELILEELRSRDAEEIRQAIQAQCDEAKVSLRIFPTRLDAPAEAWWKTQS